MKKLKKILHIVANLACVMMIVGGLLRLALCYKGLPERVGVHFSGAGVFDMVVSKKQIIYLLYPYIASFILFVIFEFLFYFSDKAKASYFSKKNEEDAKCAIALIIDYGFKTIWVFFLSIIWSESVLTQVNLNTALVSWLFLLQILSFVILLVYLVIMLVKNGKKKKKH